MTFTKGTSKSFFTNCWTTFLTNCVTLKTELTKDRQAILGLEQTANAPPLLDHKPGLFAKIGNNILRLNKNKTGLTVDIAERIMWQRTVAPVGPSNMGSFIKNRCRKEWAAWNSTTGWSRTSSSECQQGGKRGGS